MQWKLARRSRFAERYHEWAMRRGFPLLLKIAPVLPMWFLRFGARVVIGSVMGVYPAPKRDIDKNLRRILGLEVSRREIRRARRRMIHNLAYYWVDLFRFCQLPYERTREMLAALRGREHLERALAQGKAQNTQNKGVILLTAHVGNWELGGVFLREKDLEVSVVYVPDQSPTAESFRSTLRRAIGVEGIAINPAADLSSLPVLRALKEGRVVAMQGDRDFNDRGEWVEFFGAPARFPLGPMLLARMTGATLLPIFIVYDERHRLEIEFSAPIAVSPVGDRRQAALVALEHWVRVLEGAVRRWPTQWYTFFDFWAEAPPPEAGSEESAAQREAV
jgi:KDO2-lipid IV(A) lauroyltransferase